MVASLVKIVSVVNTCDVFRGNPYITSDWLLLSYINSRAIFNQTFPVNLVCLR